MHLFSKCVISPLWLSSEWLCVIYFMIFFMESAHTSLFPVFTYSPKMQIEGIHWVYHRKNLPQSKKPWRFFSSSYMYIPGKQRYPSPTSDGKYCCSGGYAAAYLPQAYYEIQVFTFSVKHRTSWVHEVPFKPNHAYCMGSKTSHRLTLEKFSGLLEERGKDFCMPCEDRINKKEYLKIN